MEMGTNRKSSVNDSSAEALGWTNLTERQCLVGNRDFFGVVQTEEPQIEDMCLIYHKTLDFLLVF